MFGVILLAASCCASLALLATPREARGVDTVVNALHQGFYDSTGFNLPTNDNYSIGWDALDATESRNYFVFNIPDSWIHWFEHPLGNKDVYDRMTFFRFAPTVGYELYDSRVLSENWEAALREKRLTMAESGRFMKRYEEALEGYTYLSLNE